MRRFLAALLLLAATGCSTAPVADVLDFFAPARMIPNGTPTSGGVGPPSAPPPAAVIQPPALPALPVPTGERPVPLAGSP